MKFAFWLSRRLLAVAATVAKDPALLIADEPTTALDTTTQREVLLLLKPLAAPQGHDDLSLRSMTWRQLRTGHPAR